MKLIDIIKKNGNRNIPYIEYRSVIDLGEQDFDLFVGLCEYKDNELISLDGDSYSLESEISYYEWFNDGGKRCLMVYR